MVTVSLQRPEVTICSVGRNPGFGGFRSKLKITWLLGFDLDC